jgi:hypothetical protein
MTLATSRPPEQALADVAALARAFLAATVETNPDTPRAELWRLLVEHRHHLAAVVRMPSGG